MVVCSVFKNFDDYDEKYMKIKFNSDDKLPLNKTVDIPTIKIFVRAIFLENKKYYPQVFLDECLYKILKWKIKNELKEFDIKKLILILVIFS